jgi:hypothetical protein
MKGIEMKSLFLAVFLTIIIVSSANAQSTLALQEKCAEGAKNFYNEWPKPKPFDIPLGYYSHYSKKLDKCFISILGRTEKQYYDETEVRVKSGVVVWGFVYDVYGRQLYALYYDCGEIKDCRIKDKEMSCTFQEYLKLIKQFMED